MTTGGGQRGGRYASYWNAVLLICIYQHNFKHNSIALFDKHNTGCLTVLDVEEARDCDTLNEKTSKPYLLFSVLFQQLCQKSVGFNFVTMSQLSHLFPPTFLPLFAQFSLDFFRTCFKLSFIMYTYSDSNLKTSLFQIIYTIILKGDTF